MERGERGVLCTLISSSGSTPRHEGSKMLVYEDGHFIGTVGGGEVESRVIHEALEALTDKKPRVARYAMANPQAGDPGVCGGTLEVYIEPILPKPVLLVVGGGHVGKAVAHLGKWLGFRVAISDDRPEFCNIEANPDGDEFILTSLDHLPSKIKINSEVYILLMTRGSAIDVDGIPALLETQAAYIGVIGSKRRWLTTRQALLEKGLSEEKIARIISPIGLELNAETPEEIAVSILAEIIMLRNGGSGVKMRI